MSVHFYNNSYYNDIVLELVFNETTKQYVNEIRNFDQKTFEISPKLSIRTMIHFHNEAKKTRIESIINYSVYFISITFKDTTEYCILPKSHVPVLFVNDPYIYSLQFRYNSPSRCIDNENTYINNITSERRTYLTRVMHYRINSKEYMKLNHNYLVLYSQQNFTGNIQFIVKKSKKHTGYTIIDRHIDDRKSDNVSILSYVNHTDKNYVLVSEDESNWYNIHKHTFSNSLQDKNKSPWYDRVYQLDNDFNTDKKNPIEFTPYDFSLFETSTVLTLPAVPSLPAVPGLPVPLPLPDKEKPEKTSVIFTNLKYLFIIIFFTWLVLPFSKYTARSIKRYRL